MAVTHLLAKFCADIFIKSGAWMDGFTKGGWDAVQNVVPEGGVT